MDVLDAVQEMAKTRVMDVENINYEASREVLKIINGHQFTEVDYLEIGKAVIDELALWNEMREKLPLR